MKRLLIAAIFLALLIPNVANANWRSNEFVSPTGNIQCWYWTPGSHIGYTWRGWGITCMTANNRRQVAIAISGHGFIVNNWPDPPVTYQHTLNYGTSYNAGRFECLSYTTQMVCNNNWTKHGFSISRSSIRTW